MARYNIRCQGIPLGNFFLSKTILFCIETFDHMKFYKRKEKGKHEIKKMIPNRQNVPPFARVLTAIICLPPHSDWVSFCCERVGRVFGFTYRKSMTSKDWQSRQWMEGNLDSVYSWTIPTCSCRWHIYSARLYTCFLYCYLYLSNFTAFNEDICNKTKLVRTSYFSELQIFFVNFRFCISYVYLLKTQMMVLTNLCSFVVTEKRAKIF